MTDAFRFDTPSDPRGLLILAHGSGQPMVSPFLDAVAAAIASNDQWPVEVARFNFPYMARAIAEGRKRPPDRTEALERSWLDAIDPRRGRCAG